MTSTNDGKDVKSNQASGHKGKSHFIELYKSLDASLNSSCGLRARTAQLSEAWRRVHSLCAHSAPSTHPHLLAWIQRHTARTILQTEWQSQESKDEYHHTLDAAIKDHTLEAERAILSRSGHRLLWESQLLERAIWFRSVLDNPWDHPVLKILLDSKEKPPSDELVLEWLCDERGVTFATRLRQLALSKGCDDLALSLTTAVMDRLRAGTQVVPDTDQVTDTRDKPLEREMCAFERALRQDAGFTQEVWDYLTDIELLLLHKRDNERQIINLAKATPLRSGHTLVERLASRLESAPGDKKIWKNAREVAIIVAQVIIARCMLIPECVGAGRAALYACGRSVARLVRPERRPRVASALAKPAATARHLYTLAVAHHTQLADCEDQRGFVCELYIRAITTGMNELEKLKVDTAPDKEKEARLMEQTLATWFIQLGKLLEASARVRCECELTAFSVHPSLAMYERLKVAPSLPPLAVEPQETEDKELPNSEFGSWANDSHQQTNFVKTSETLNLKVTTQKMANVLSTAIFTEGEGLGLSPELSNDLAVLLSGPRVKTLSWDMGRELLLENCRAYMERTSGGTRALTTELRFLNLDPRTYQHLPEEEDGEDDLYYGIEKGYEHLVEFEPQPEEIWQDAYSDPDRIYSEQSDVEDTDYGTSSSSRRKTKKNKRISESDTDPLSLIAESKREEKKKERSLSKERSLAADTKREEKKKERPLSKERSLAAELKREEKKKERALSKERSKEPKKKSKAKDTPKDKDKEPKAIKEKKPRKKKVKSESQGLNLSQLLGVKVAGTSFEDEFRNSLKAGTVAPVGRGTPVTDSDYDSQGKSSFHSEGTEPEALRDSSFPVDELIKTLETREHVKDSISKLLQFRKQKADEEAKQKSKPSSVPGLESQSNLSSLVGSKIVKKESPSQSTYRNKSSTGRKSSLLLNSNKKCSNTLPNNLVNANKSTASSTGPKKRGPQKKLAAALANTAPGENTNIQSTVPSQSHSSPNILKKSTASSIGTLGYFDLHQNSYQRFLMELQETKRLALVRNSENKEHDNKSVTKETQVVPNKNETATPPCAKPSQQKIENAPNTFARRNHMHQTNKLVAKKQELLQSSISRELDQRIADLSLSKIRNLQAQDLSISRVGTKEENNKGSPKVEIQKVEKPTPASHLGIDHPILSDMLEGSEVKIARNPAYVKESPKQTTNQTKSPPSMYSKLSEKDQQDVLNLLLQQSKLNSTDSQSANIPSSYYSLNKNKETNSILRIQNELMSGVPIQPAVSKLPNTIPQTTVIQTANMVQFLKPTKSKPKVKHCMKNENASYSTTTKTYLNNNQIDGKKPNTIKQTLAPNLNSQKNPAVNLNSPSPQNCTTDIKSSVMDSCFNNEIAAYNSMFTKIHSTHNSEPTVKNSAAKSQVTPMDAASNSHIYAMNYVGHVAANTASNSAQTAVTDSKNHVPTVKCNQITATATNDGQNSQTAAAKPYNGEVSALSQKNAKLSQNWTSVMDTLRKLKNPSRGPSAIDLVLGRDSQTNSTTGALRQQRIVKTNSSSMSLEKPQSRSGVQPNATFVSSPKSSTIVASVDSNKKVLKPKSSQTKPRKPRTKPTVINQPMEALEVKKPTIQYPKKEPIGSGIPHSDYETMLGELFDEDLLQEIDESPVLSTRPNELKNYTEQTKLAHTTVAQSLSILKDTRNYNIVQNFEPNSAKIADLPIKPEVAANAPIKEKPRILSNVTISPNMSLSPEIRDALAKNVSKTIPVKLTDMVTPVRSLKATPPPLINQPKKLDANHIPNIGLSPACQGNVPNNVQFMASDNFTAGFLGNVNKVIVESVTLYTQPQCVTSGGPILITVPQNTQSPKLAVRTSQNIAFEEIISSSTSMSSRAMQGSSSMITKTENVKSKTNSSNDETGRTAIVAPTNIVRCTPRTSVEHQLHSKPGYQVTNDADKQSSKKELNDPKHNYHLSESENKMVFKEESLNMPIQIKATDKTGKHDDRDIKLNLPKLNEECLSVIKENIGKLDVQINEKRLSVTTDDVPITTESEAKLNEKCLLAIPREADNDVQITKSNLDKLTEKRLSIINRQVEVTCNSSSIALTYTPINMFDSSPKVASRSSVIQTTTLTKPEQVCQSPKLVEKNDVILEDKQCLEGSKGNENRPSCLPTESHSNIASTSNGPLNRLEEIKDKSEDYQNNKVVALEASVNVNMHHPEKDITELSKEIIVDDTMTTVDSIIASTNNGELEELEDKSEVSQNDEVVAFEKNVNVNVHHLEKDITQQSKEIIVNDTMKTVKESSETSKVTKEKVETSDKQEKVNLIESTTNSTSNKTDTSTATSNSFAPTRVSKRIQSRKVKKAQDKAKKAEAKKTTNELKSKNALEKFTSQNDDSLNSVQIPSVTHMKHDTRSNGAAMIENILKPIGKENQTVPSENYDSVEKATLTSQTEHKLTKLVNEMKTTIDVITKTNTDVVTIAENYDSDQLPEQAVSLSDTIKKEASVTESFNSLSHTTKITKANKTKVTKVAEEMHSKKVTDMQEKLLNQENKIQACKVPQIKCKQSQSIPFDFIDTTLTGISDVVEKISKSDNKPAYDLATDSIKIETNVNKHESSETLIEPREHNIISQTYKNSIVFTELPMTNPVPNTKVVRITMPNNKVFKATVHGKVDVSFDTLFEVPALKNLLLSGMDAKKLYNVNIRNSDISQVSKENVDTINLISDDEDDTAPTTPRNDKPMPCFLTEFGKYSVRDLDIEVYKKHQFKFSQKCFLKLQRCDLLPSSARAAVGKECDEIFETCSLSDEEETHELPKDVHVIPEVIDIDDSSCDSDCVPVDVRKVDIDEFKHLLLKDYRDVLTPQNEQQIKTCKSSPSSVTKIATTELLVECSEKSNESKNSITDVIEINDNLENLSIIPDSGLNSIATSSPVRARSGSLSLLSELDDGRSSPVIDISGTLSSFLDDCKIIKDTDMASVNAVDYLSDVKQKPEIHLVPIFCDTDWHVTKRTFNKLTSRVNTNLKLKMHLHKYIKCNATTSDTILDDSTDCEDLSPEVSYIVPEYKVLPSVSEAGDIMESMEYKHKSVSCFDVDWFMTKRILSQITSRVTTDLRPKAPTHDDNALDDSMDGKGLSSEGSPGTALGNKDMIPVKEMKADDVTELMDVEMKFEHKPVPLCFNTYWFVTKRKLHQFASEVNKDSRLEKPMLNTKLNESTKYKELNPEDSDQDKDMTPVKEADDITESINLHMKPEHQPVSLCFDADWLTTKRLLNQIQAEVDKESILENSATSTNYEYLSPEDSDSIRDGEYDIIHVKEVDNVKESVDSAVKLENRPVSLCFDADWLATKRKLHQMAARVDKDLTLENTTTSANYELLSTEDSCDKSYGDIDMAPLKEVDDVKELVDLESKLELKLQPVSLCFDAEWLATKLNLQQIAARVDKKLIVENPNSSANYDSDSKIDGDNDITPVKEADVIMKLEHQPVTLCFDTEWSETKRKHNQISAAADKDSRLENQTTTMNYERLSTEESDDESDEDMAHVEEADGVKELLDLETKLQNQAFTLCFDADWLETKKKLQQIATEISHTENKNNDITPGKEADLIMELVDLEHQAVTLCFDADWLETKRKLNKIAAGVDKDSRFENLTTSDKQINQSTNYEEPEVSVGKGNRNTYMTSVKEVGDEKLVDKESKRHDQPVSLCFDADWLLTKRKLYQLTLTLNEEVRLKIPVRDLKLNESIGGDLSNVKIATIKSDTLNVPSLIALMVQYFSNNSIVADMNFISSDIEQSLVLPPPTLKRKSTDNLKNKFNKIARRRAALPEKLPVDVEKTSANKTKGIITPREEKCGKDILAQHMDNDFSKVLEPKTDETCEISSVVNEIIDVIVSTEILDSADYDITVQVDSESETVCKKECEHMCENVTSSDPVTKDDNHNACTKLINYEKLDTNVSEDQTQTDTLKSHIMQSTDLMSELTNENIDLVNDENIINSNSNRSVGLDSAFNEVATELISQIDDNRNVTGTDKMMCRTNIADSVFPLGVKNDQQNIEVISETYDLDGKSTMNADSHDFEDFYVSVADKYHVMLNSTLNCDDEIKETPSKYMEATEHISQVKAWNPTETDKTCNKIDEVFESNIYDKVVNKPLPNDKICTSNVELTSKDKQTRSNDDLSNSAKMTHPEDAVIKKDDTLTDNSEKLSEIQKEIHTENYHVTESKLLQEKGKLPANNGPSHLDILFPSEVIKDDILIDMHSGAENEESDATLVEKSIQEVNFDDKILENNATLIYGDESGVVLKGIEYEDPIMGTCYVFPLVKSPNCSELLEEGYECVIEGIKDTDINDSEIPECENASEDAECLPPDFPDESSYEKFKLKALRDYSNKSRKRKSHSLSVLSFTGKRPRRSRSRDSENSEIYYYGTKRHIDARKIIPSAIHDLSYEKDFQRLIDYYSTQKFSYSLSYGIEHIEAITLLKRWPINSIVDNTFEGEIEDFKLFTDIDNKPYEPEIYNITLAAELSGNGKKVEPQTEAADSNFNKGFGEGSGRVIQDLSLGAISKFSAATLSDVKQYQPVLLSECDSETIHDTFLCSTQGEQEGVQRFIRNLQLRKKIQSFFQTSLCEINNDSFIEKEKENKPLSKTDANFPFNNYINGNLLPSSVDVVVNVVQVGQLPVSASAQNPMTCDPRVTHVSDASPSQCSVDNSSPNDTEPGMKTEYTELTTANLSMPIIGQEYEQSRESLNSVPPCENITIESSLIKSEIRIEIEEETQEESEFNTQDQVDFKSRNKENFNNIDCSSETNDNNGSTHSEPNVKQQLSSSEVQGADVSKQKQLNGSSEKTNQIAHAMNAAGITVDEESNTENRTQALVNLFQNIGQNVSTSQNSTTSYPKTTSINAISLQQALAQILPSSLNQTVENNPHGLNSVTPQVLHIVQGKNTSGNITLVDNSQQPVLNSPNATPVLHLLQNKATNGCPSNNGSAQQQNTFSSFSFVDAGIQSGGNQLLHIVNTGNQKNSNAGQLLKRVNLLTNLTNVQGSNEQKMLQFVCKSADGKSIQLNAPHQRSMVLRLQPIETPNVQTPPQKHPENHNVSPTSANTHALPNKDNSASQQEIKSRSVYEENYAKFIQNSSPKPGLEKSTSLPKFNQAFGKPVFEEGNEKESEINSNEVNLSSVNPDNENPECQNTENAINLDHISSMSSPPLLLRKSPAQVSQAQANLVQQIKQTIAPMNIQTMHGGVIYTRQLPVIGGGQTINLISVPTNELFDEAGQKQSEVKFVSQSDAEPSIIKIVPQTQAPLNTEVPQEDGNVTVQNDGQNSQPQPVLTQMRIKLPMLSKNPQMIAGARVVRPSFFQIQRNVIGGANQQVYQQLVLTAAPPLGQQTIRLTQPQTQVRPSKAPDNQSPSESQLSSSTLEQLREFDMVLEQVKERSTVQPSASSGNTFTLINAPSTDSTDSPVSTASTPAEPNSTQVLYTIGGNQPLSVAYGNRKSTVTTSTASNYARSPDSSGLADSPSSSTQGQIPHTVTTETAQTTQNESSTTPPKPAKVHSKSKSKSKSSSHSSHTVKVSPVTAPKPSTQKPLEDEQTTQRILYILAEYKEQVENSPDKDKPAPRRRTNPPSNPGSSRRKKRRSGARDVSPVQGEDTCRTMGSEDSSCGTSQGDCSENCFDNSPQGSPRKVIRKLTFDQDSSSQPKPQPPRNVIVADGQTITVARGTTGKPATAVIMPANYLLPVSMVKGGQQIAIVTNHGPKILTVTGGENPTANALLLQRLIGPAGLKPVLTRPGIRHVRLPAAALQRIQAFNLAATADTATATPSAAQPPDSTASPAPEPTTPDLVEPQASTSPPWADRESDAAKPDRASSPEGSEPWNIPASAEPHEYSYEETVRTDNLDRTVLDAIPDRYSPDMEAHRIFDKMFDVESKKCFVDSPRGYDIDASDCEDKTYQVVQKKDMSAARQHRLAHVSALALRHKYAILEHELRLQKSLSEECEDLGVDSPMPSDLFPEAELLFSGSPAPAHDHATEHAPHHSNASQPTILNETLHTEHIEAQIPTDLPCDRPDMGDLIGEIPVTDQGVPITLDQEEFARSHPNTTFHSEPTDDGEVQPFTLSALKTRHITSTYLHPNRTSTTVLMTAPQTTVISQNDTGDHVKYGGIDLMHLPQSSLNLNSVLVKDDGLTRFDSILTDTRELHLSNTASAIVHSASATQVIRRVCYEEDKRERERFLIDEPESLIAGKDAKMVAEDNSRDATLDSLPGDVDDGNSSPERHTELFWESNSASERSESRRPLDFSSDSEKCCKSPLYDETNSTDSSGVGAHMRLDSVIKEARGVERRCSADGSSADDTHPPLRTYPAKRHADTDRAMDRSLSGKTRAGESSSSSSHHSLDNHAPDSHSTDSHAPDNEVRRRASNRGVVKRGCHCCNGSPAPPRPKKPRQKKNNADFTNNH